MGGFRFSASGLRTDGREVRAHKPWRLNDGTETANRSVAPGIPTTRTDFASALSPRLGGIMQPQLGGMNPTSGPLARSSPLGQPPAAVSPGTMAGEDQIAQLGSSLSIPSDAPAANPMFAAVSDAGAEPTLNTAQEWTRAGRQATKDGWVQTTPQQARGIAQQFAPKNNRFALGGAQKNLPY